MDNVPKQTMIQVLGQTDKKLLNLNRTISNSLRNHIWTKHSSSLPRLHSRQKIVYSENVGYFM